jgi:hypothetical protein
VCLGSAYFSPHTLLTSPSNASKSHFKSDFSLCLCSGVRHVVLKERGVFSGVRRRVFGSEDRVPERGFRV